MLLSASEYYKIVRGTAVTPTQRAVAQAIPEVLDANGDGISDILVFGAYYPFNGTTPTGQPATLMLGKADGSYSVSTSIIPSTFTTVHPREVVQADFNGDGRTDLFVADHGYDVTPFPGAQNKLLLSTAAGGYVDASANLPQVSDFTHSATAADINGDGKQDLFIGNMSSSASPAESYVLLGDGKGGFVRTNAGLPLDNGGLLDRKTGNLSITASLLTDLNGDGRPDLVIGNDGGTYTREHRSLVYWNTGAGFDATNMAFLPQGYFGEHRLVHDIASLDIDGDGDNDLLLLSSESVPVNAYADGWSLEVLRNDNGSFVDATAEHFALADSREGLPNADSKIGASQFIRLLDANGDGSKDVVITQFMNNQPTANTPIVWVNDGFGHFEVAMRAGQMNTLANDSYFVGVFNVPVQGAKGTGFSSININGDTIYTTTAVASQPLPGPVAIKATARNDVIAQNANSNAIDGGAGVDTVVYTKLMSSYTVALKNGQYSVQDKGGRDGLDTLTNVERARFTDKSLAFDIDGVAGQAYRLYRAAFDREPDHGGLGYWINALDGGMKLSDAALLFVSSPEFKSLYGASLSNGAMLTEVYDNVLHRVPDAGGYKFWLDQLDSGSLSVQEMLVWFSESAENKVQVIGAIENGIPYNLYGV